MMRHDIYLILSRNRMRPDIVFLLRQQPLCHQPPLYQPKPPQRFLCRRLQLTKPRPQQYRQLARLFLIPVANLLQLLSWAIHRFLLWDSISLFCILDNLLNLSRAKYRIVFDPDLYNVSHHTFHQLLCSPFVVWRILNYNLCLLINHRI